MNYLLIFLSVITFSAFAQTKINRDSSKNDEQHLKMICDRLYRAETDAAKKIINQELINAFEEILNQPNSFDLSFESLKNDMAILVSPDSKFKLINWNIEKNDKTFEYYGFIQEKHIQITKKSFLKKSKTETVQLHSLIDKSSEIKNPENFIGDNKKWYGMLYYKIIVKKSKSKTYYTLLGKDENDKYSSKKIIDVLTFDEKGTPHFGADIFVMNKKFPKRVIFEYGASCSMSLRYSPQKDSIVFDHLAPTNPQLEGQFQYYCGDMSYDGFGFKRGKWVYGTDLNALNDRTESDKLYKDPHNPGSTKQSDLIIERKQKKKKN